MTLGERENLLVAQIGGGWPPWGQFGQDNEGIDLQSNIIFTQCPQAKHGQTCASCISHPTWSRPSWSHNGAFGRMICQPLVESALVESALVDWLQKFPRFFWVLGSRNPQKFFLSFWVKNVLIEEGEHSAVFWMEDVLVRATTITPV